MSSHRTPPPPGSVGRRTFRQGAGWARLRREALGGLGILASAVGLRVEGYRRPAPLSGLDVRTDPRLPRPRPVTVGVPTFRREEQLADLLGALVPQLRELRAGTAGEGSRPGSPAAGRPVRLVVADNSPEGGARDVVERAARAAREAPGGAVEVLHLHEQRPGVVHVRNTILDHCLPGGYLAFIDDDQLPDDGWLTALVAVGERSGAAGVSGHVHFVLGDEVDPWIAHSGHFTRPTWRSGQEVAGAGAGNLLLDLHQLHLAGLRFDTGYSLTGGEDSRLVRDLRLAGGTVVAAPQAGVRESVPAERATRAWVLQRARRNAETWARVRADVRPGEGVHLPAARVPTILARAAARGARGAGRLAAARRSGDPARIAAAEVYLAGAAGLLRGALGVNREEYGRPDLPG